MSGEFALLEPRDGAGSGHIADGQLAEQGHVLAHGEAVVAGLAGDDLGRPHRHPRDGLDLDGVPDGPVLVLDDAGVVPVVLQPVVLYGQLSALGDPHYGETTVPASLTHRQAVFSPGDVGPGTPAMWSMTRGGPRTRPDYTSPSVSWAEQFYPVAHIAGRQLLHLNT